MADPAAVVALVVRVAVEHAEAVTSLLFDAGAGGVEQRDAVGGVELRVYAVQDDARAMRSALERLCSESGIAVDIALEPVPADWDRKWTESLVAVLVADDLWLAPEGDRPPGPGVIVLTRRMAFGFGDHATTRMAARAVVQACRARPGLDVLDFGTGGGALALLAERAGAGKVLGVDKDPTAIAAARDNARLNGSVRCRFTMDDLAAASGSFDLVVANVDYRTLVESASLLACRVRQDGALLLTGVLTEDEAGLMGAYEREGLALHRKESDGDWLMVELAHPGAEDRG